MTEVQMRQGMRSRRTDDLSTFSRNISTPAQQSSLKENIMEKQAMGISLHCWTQGPKSQSTNIVFVYPDTKRKEHRPCLRKS